MGTFSSLLPAAFPVPRTMPGTYKILRKHEQSIFLCRALGERRQVNRFLSSQAELMVPPEIFILDWNVEGRSCQQLMRCELRASFPNGGISILH